MVYTRANIWSTVSTETPIPEDRLCELCPIKLLYIEPGVYGELTPWSARRTQTSKSKNCSKTTVLDPSASSNNLTKNQPIHCEPTSAIGGDSQPTPNRGKDGKKVCNNVDTGPKCY